MEEILDQKTIEEIKKQLLEGKVKIKKDLTALSKKDSHEVDNMTAKFPEYGDKADENAQEINDYSTNLVAEKVLEKSLEDINNALERIDNGTYGICKYCHQPIGKKRILARPTAGACIECKTKLQQSNA